MRGMRPRLDERLPAFASAWNWSAILAGVFVSLALYLVLGLFGAAVAASTGDHILEGGFALWSLLARLAALFIGAAFAAYLSRTSSVTQGIAAGLFTWAVALVAWNALLGDAFGPQAVGSALWSAFFAALLGLAVAGFGGLVGARLGRRAPVDHPGYTSTPVVP
jgi:hypothetical protein